MFTLENLISHEKGVVHVRSSNSFPFFDAQMSKQKTAKKPLESQFWVFSRVPVQSNATNKWRKGNRTSKRTLCPLYLRKMQKLRNSCLLSEFSVVFKLGKHNHPIVSEGNHFQVRSELVISKRGDDLRDSDGYSCAHFALVT